MLNIKIGFWVRATVEYGAHPLRRQQIDFRKKLLIQSGSLRLFASLFRLTIIFNY